MLRSSSGLCLARRFVPLLLLLPAFSSLARAQVRLPPGRQSSGQRIQRELWFRRGRRVQPPSTAGPASAAALLQRGRGHRPHIQPKSLAASSVAASPPASAWAPLGPAPLLSNATGSLGEQDYGPITGPVTALAVDPNDGSGNTVYIGAANGGVWKSSNAAAADPATVAWTPLTDQQPTLSTGAIAIQPGNSQVILVGTGEPNPLLDSYSGLGILRSTDGGADWTLISSADSGSTSFAGLGFSKIAFSTANPNRTVAAAGKFLFESGSNPGTGMYYSPDAGATWHSTVMQDGAAAATPASVTDVAYNPSAGRFFAAMAWHGIYGSSDGVTWSRLPNQPGGALLSSTACPASGASTCPILRGEIAVRSGKNEMYVWYISGDPATGELADQGIWKTTDGGATWTAISTNGIENCGDFAGCGAADQGWYSLELAAVPNANNTDLYAGATNLYKCSINSVNPSCDAHPFLNLTHVYGCTPVGSLAHVYPNQHALGFQVAGTKAVLYLGNDGGVSRALDGYGLSSGACDQPPNDFQNLNGTLGSLASLISFTQHPSSAATALAGAQENGSAATDLRHTGDNGTTWVAVNGGWGGFTAINPGNTSQWFTADAGVSVQSCSNGINCRAQDFTVVVSSATLGGDAGAFSTPYRLDPQANSRMLLGTCRVWRGNSDGSGFSALSYNFDTFADTPCGGAEENLISALAAGGTPVPAAGSPVIYAGTAAGRIFATTDAAAGPDAWYEATPSAAGYPISSIVLDPADPTAKTAYAAGMGFGAAHVWLTTDAGLSWTDVTADLPDAPVNSLLIDPDGHQRIYAGSDVGVFSADMTNTGNVTWQNLADSALPNAPVTQLAMFKSDTLKTLRAATYGRGAWELALYSPAPDYTISLDNSLLLLFPDQEGSFTGKLTALYGYNSPVTVSCEAAILPDVCSGQTVTPSPAGRPYEVKVRHGSVADLSLNLKVTGTDPAATVHSTAATLRVMDFGLAFAPGTPTPVSLTVNSGSNTDAVSLVLQAEGAFGGAVSLSCGGLPAGATCIFSPSNLITVPTGGSSTVSIFISTLDSTPNTNAQTVTISATTAGAPTPKTQALLLTVNNEPDYGLQLDPATLPANPGDTVTARLTITAVHNYKGIVAVSCGASMLAGVGCSLSATSVYLTNATTSAVTVTLTVPPTATAGMYTVAINTQDQNGGPAHIAYAILNVVSGFVMSVGQATVTVQPGGTATYSLRISPLGGAFNSAIALTCAGLPPHSTASFNPSLVTLGDKPSAATLNVVTSTVSAAVPSINRGLWVAILLPFAAVLASGSAWRRRRLRLALVLGSTGLYLALLLGCGGGGAVSSSPPIVPPNNTATPTGTYTLVVTGTSVGVPARSLELTLIVR